jgi:hypothetical protein
MRRLVPIVLLLVLWVPSAQAWTWPVVGPVLQGFSFDPAHPYAAGQHRGIDVGAPGSGGPVLAPAAGVVSFAGTVPTSGKSVTIETSDGLSVTLTHLGSIGVSRDAAVVEGAVVGTVGPSGTPDFDGPYVHMGVRTASNPQGYLDPLAFLPVLGAPAPIQVPAAPVEPSATPAPAPMEPPVETAPAAAPPVSEPDPVAPPAAVAPAGAAPPTAVEPTPVVTAPPGETASPAKSAAPVAAAPPAAAPQPATPAAPVQAHEQQREPEPVVREAPTGQALAAAPLGAAGAVPLATYAPAAAPRGVQPGRPMPSATAPRVAALGVPSRAVRRAHQGASPSTHVSRSTARLVVALLVLAGLAAAGLAAVRIIRSPSPTSEGARPDAIAAEDPRRAGLAVREWAAPHRPRGGVRRAGGRFRALPPAQGQRRPDGVRDGRARHTGDGVRRPERRLTA